jgi:hypothetical protein
VRLTRFVAPTPCATLMISINSAVARQDASGNSWLSYNEQTWLAKRHALGREAEASIGSLTAALAGLAAAATGSQ